jgi:hypothetical protein
VGIGSVWQLVKDMAIVPREKNLKKLLTTPSKRDKIGAICFAKNNSSFFALGIDQSD